MSSVLGDSMTDVETTGSPCVACRLPLPIAPAPVDQQGEFWHCTKCDTRHHGMLLENPPAEIAGNVRPSETRKETVVTPQVESTPTKGSATKPLPSRAKVICREETETSKQLDQQIKRPGTLDIKITGPAFASQVKQHGKSRFNPATETQFNKQYDQSSDQVEMMVASLEKGRALDVGQTQTVTRESLSQVAEDMDLFVKLGINPPDRNYVGKHNYHVAMLATSMGVTLGWDEKTLVDLGIGCLLHDVGMARVPEAIRNANKILGPEEFAEIARHPLHTFEMLDSSTQSISPLSRLVAYQIHERCNGAGYPRNRTADTIHEAAKVAAVADVFIALISPRPHRQPMMPHFAAVHMLLGVRNGEFDSSAVRALLKTISLYPIGSFLEIEDGRVGKVMRANADLYARPIVEFWKTRDIDSDSEVVDLAEQEGLSILGPVESLEK